jgi:hypothetical protein
LLERSSAELFAANGSMMHSGDLLPTKNKIDDGDVELFFAGVNLGLIRLQAGGKFNTFDRPTSGGRWSLLSRSQRGGWYNAEYLPQLAAYVDAIERLGYPKERVLFELPAEALQLDLGGCPGRPWRTAPSGDLHLVQLSGPHMALVANRRDIAIWVSRCRLKSDWGSVAVPRHCRDRTQ